MNIGRGNFVCFKPIVSFKSFNANDTMYYRRHEIEDKCCLIKLKKS